MQLGSVATVGQRSGRELWPCFIELNNKSRDLTVGLVAVLAQVQMMGFIYLYLYIYIYLDIDAYIYIYICTYEFSADILKQSNDEKGCHTNGGGP